MLGPLDCARPDEHNDPWPHPRAAEREAFERSTTHGAPYCLTRNAEHRRDFGDRVRGGILARCGRGDVVQHHDRKHRRLRGGRLAVAEYTCANCGADRTDEVTRLGVRSWARWRCDCGAFLAAEGDADGGVRLVAGLERREPEPEAVRVAVGR